MNIAQTLVWSTFLLKRRSIGGRYERINFTEEITKLICKDYEWSHMCLSEKLTCVQIKIKVAFVATRTMATKWSKKFMEFVLGFYGDNIRETLLVTIMFHHH